MRSIRILPLLACAAFAVAALAAPALAPASGGQWTQDNVPLAGEAEAGVNGKIGWISEWGGFECPTHANATLEAPDGGSLGSLEMGGCEGLGAWEGCTLVDFEAAPMSLEAGTDEVAIGGLEIWQEFNSSCAVSEVTFFADEIAATPDNTTWINDLAFEEEGTLDLFGYQAEIEVSGNLGPDEPGAFGIGLFEPGELSGWTKNGKALSQPETVELSGQIADGQLSTWGYTCPVSGEAALEPGSPYAETSFEIDSEQCEGSGQLAGCEVVSLDANLPRLMAAYEDGEETRKAALVTAGSEGQFGYDVTYQFDSECPLPFVRVLAAPQGYSTEPFLEAEADDPSAISSLSGETLSVIWPEYGAFESDGAFAFDLSPEGEYGIQ